MSTTSRFLFGAPVLPRRTKHTSHKKLFILGAYPSALHIRWTDQDGIELIKAVAVDNEPTPFWDGENLQEHFASWRSNVDWHREWGHASVDARSNGPSGIWVRTNVLEPLHSNSHDVWISDCLDTYRQSKDASEAFQRPEVRTFINLHRIPEPRLLPHPSEAAIVQEALSGANCRRLREELRLCEPEIIITLGNAALRVLQRLFKLTSVPSSVTSIPSGYGSAYSVVGEGNTVIQLLPLAHPGAPSQYQEAHKRWIESQKRLI